jgi:molybdate transport system substrate-binding protein
VRIGPTLLVLAAISLLGCGVTGAPPTPSPALTVYGAASLRNVLEDVRAAYESAVPGTALTISTDSSAALVTQIEQGAPADVFLSADTSNPQKLVDGGLADDEAVVFAGNELTIIAPADDQAAVTGPFDIAREGVRVVAAGDAVPITRYATQLVENLAAEPGAPVDFVARYLANIVSREDNVAAVRTKIELGEGDAAIIYVTDAAASDRVTTIEVPDSANVRASYAAVVIRDSPNVEAARAFLDWLVGPDGQAILARSGFLPPAP